MCNLEKPEMHMRLSTVPGSRRVCPQCFAELEAARSRSGISVAQLCAVAGVSHTTWHRARRSGYCRASTLRKLRHALAELQREQDMEMRMGDRVAPLYRMVFAMLAVEAGLCPETALALEPRQNRHRDPNWAAAAQVRRQALYLVVTLLDVPGAVAADAVGVSKQAVSKALSQVEDSRDDPATDALLARMEALARQEVAA